MTSTSRMIDALLRALDLRTMRFTSLLVEKLSERISVDGAQLDDEAFVHAAHPSGLKQQRPQTWGA